MNIKLKYLFLMILSCVSFVVMMASSCNNNHRTNDIGTISHMTNNKIKIKINSQSFSATLVDNEAAKSFMAMLPLTLKLEDYNGSEKKYDFPKTFPTDNFSPERINLGDLMIWSGNTLVLFYKSFPTSYSYTRLGKVDNPTGLEKALGSGNVSVTFEKE